MQDKNIMFSIGFICYAIAYILLLKSTFISLLLIIPLIVFGTILLWPILLDIYILLYGISMFIMSIIKDIKKRKRKN